MHIKGKVICLLDTTPFFWVSLLIAVSPSSEPEMKLKETGNVACMSMRSYVGIIVGQAKKLYRSAKIFTFSPVILF